MCAELQALEQEQRQIDGRAAEVETQLRSLMESGGWASGVYSPAHATRSALPDLGRSWEEVRLGSLASFTAGHTEALSQEADCSKGARPLSQPPAILLLPPGWVTGLVIIVLARLRCQQAAGGDADPGVVYTGQQEECSHPEAGPAAAAVSGGPSHAGLVPRLPRACRTQGIGFFA